MESRLVEFGTELFFFVVGRDKDLVVLVEAVDQAFDGVGRGRAHAATG